MIVYQIRDWDSHFENNKSRERNDCSFVCVPNKQHGLGFQRVVSEKDGSTIYGIWHMIVGTCSRQKKPRLGWLTQDGHQTGTPLTPDDLSLQFRRPVKEVERALEFLSSPRVGWMICYDLPEVADNEYPALSAREVPADCPNGAPEEKRREENGIEEKRTLGATEKPSPTSDRDLSQDDWLKLLAADPAYEGIDVAIQFARMVQWCKANNKQSSRRRFVNWLNRCDRPLKSTATATDHANGF